MSMPAERRQQADVGDRQSPITEAAIKSLVPLASSSKTFLTVYLNTGGETIPRNVQARIIDLLDRYGDRTPEPTQRHLLHRERTRLVSLLSSLRPIGPGLMLLSSEDADLLSAYWLPMAVPDHVRLGAGAHVLPLLDITDELEPVGVALVEKNKARLLAVALGRLIDAIHMEANVPGREKAGGWASARYQRHAEEMAEQHLKDAARQLDEFQRKHHFRRLFLGGPPEALAVFKEQLSTDMAQRVAGDLALDAHASNTDLALRVLEPAQAAERRDERALVEVLVTRSEKDAGAVTGPAATLESLRLHRIETLVLDPVVEQPGRMCRACDLLFSEETIVCPYCDHPTELVELREELPRQILGQDMKVELVHGDAASLLWDQGSIGAVLKQEKH